MSDRTHQPPDHDTPQPSAAGRRRSGRTAAIVAVVAVAVTAAMLLPQVLTGGDGGTRPSSSRTPAPTSSEDAAAQDATDALAGLARREADDPTALGNEDAPVVLIEYSDFQCPFCRRFATDTEPVLVQRFVDDGTLRIEWRDFPYLGEESKTAAHAGRAAAMQGGFWDFHKAMYAESRSPNSGTITTDYLVEKAREAGLDVDAFRRDLDSQQVAQAVERDFSEGLSIGVNGTPTFLVNGEPIIGAQPLEVFVDAIERAAADAG